MLLDSYHWYTNGLSTDDLLQLRAEDIVHVHINDAKDLPIAELLDHERLYPGEGVIDLAGFLESLRKIGYKGAVAQEVLALHPAKAERNCWPGPELVLTRYLALMKASCLEQP